MPPYQIQECLKSVIKTIKVLDTVAEKCHSTAVPEQTAWPLASLKTKSEFSLFWELVPSMFYCNCSLQHIGLAFFLWKQHIQYDIGLAYQGRFFSDSFWPRTAHTTTNRCFHLLLATQMGQFIASSDNHCFTADISTT